MGALAACYICACRLSEDCVEAERRQVTVLFADMVGFTTFSERSGEEAAFTLMRSLSKLMEEAVASRAAWFRALPATASWRSSARRSRSRTRRCGRVARRCRSCSGCTAAAAISKQTWHAAATADRPQHRAGGGRQGGGGADAGVTVLGDTVNFAARLQAWPSRIRCS